MIVYLPFEFSQANEILNPKQFIKIPYQLKPMDMPIPKRNKNRRALEASRDNSVVIAIW